jgi:hypothetical protein
MKATRPVVAEVRVGGAWFASGNTYRSSRGEGSAGAKTAGASVFVHVSGAFTIGTTNDSRVIIQKDSRVIIQKSGRFVIDENGNREGHCDERGSNNANESEFHFRKCCFERVKCGTGSL